MATSTEVQRAADLSAYRAAWANMRRYFANGQFEKDYQGVMLDRTAIRGLVESLIDDIEKDYGLDAKGDTKEPRITDLVMLVGRLVQQVRRHDIDNPVAAKAMDYLRRKSLSHSILREVRNQQGQVVVAVTDTDFSDAAQEVTELRRTIIEQAAVRSACLKEHTELSEAVKRAGYRAVRFNKELRIIPVDGTNQGAWAWAVVDPNNRLRNSDGDKVDTLICWDRDMAVSIRDDAEDDMEEGEEQKPYIVDLVPAGAKQCA